MLPEYLNVGHGTPLTTPRVASTSVATLPSAIRRQPQMVWVWIMRVEARRAMSMLSDHVLRGVGLTRADIE